MLAEVFGLALTDAEGLTLLEAVVAGLADGLAGGRLPPSMTFIVTCKVDATGG